MEEVVRNGWIRARTLGGYGNSSSGVECNLCGWRGPQFLTHCAIQYVDRNAFCPRCTSYPRHRGFAWLLRNRLGTSLDSLNGVDGLRLVCAPEPGMIRLLEEKVAGLEGTDIFALNEHVKYIEDLQSLSFADDSVAFVSCFHVLEHVPNDRQALRELLRVLHPAGHILLCVPMTLGRAETIDFGGPNALLNDHCFDYGEDFVDRLTAEGFSGESYRLLDAVPKELHARLAMTQEVIYLLHRTEPGLTPAVRAN
ncbi:MAG: SAM-dependent methyltransferase [Planctomycetota bacterium]|jgi:SAM-dependent methyltransferase